MPWTNVQNLVPWYCNDQISKSFCDGCRGRSRIFPARWFATDKNQVHAIIGLLNLMLKFGPEWGPHPLVPPTCAWTTVTLLGDAVSLPYNGAMVQPGTANGLIIGRVGCAFRRLHKTALRQNMNISLLRAFWSLDATLTGILSELVPSTTSSFHCCRQRGAYLVPSSFALRVIKGSHDASYGKSTTSSSWWSTLH